ncbi:mechanosensitive ion channel family protein [Flavobacterium sp. 7A]|uniref:mechanosensitive ion channel family protein n=1 Tax=Flavobacterium sp. 7A TaxID=2940571 RepID=UPI0022267B01|nr:mechanosensitive ion channel family protein [Flavobacterium sp. 7A]MCW2120560.1 small-conductance mechanosensitive channel [Flavobacterium sp. 7A]
MKTLYFDFTLLITIGVIVIITITLALIFKYIAENFIHKEIFCKHIDPTSYIFVKKIISTIIYVVGFSFALEQIPEMKIIGHSLLAGAGILSLVAGLASQQALSNVMSGFLIVLFKPFKINDRITFGGTYTGTVEEINLRQVVIRDPENNRVIVPNSLISNQVVINANLTETKICKMIEIGIGYSSDINKALKILEEEIEKHPLHIDNRTVSEIANKVPKVISRVVALGDSSVTLKAWAYSDSSQNGFIMYCDLLKSIKYRFEEENIEIPYNYQNVIIKTTE